jgi:diguanylate cyclase (GGDEF)-like protein
MIETLIGLGVLALLNFFVFRDSPAFNNVSPHPYFLVLLPIASRYGFKAGLFAAGACSLLYLGSLLPTRPDLSPIDMRSWEYWGPPLLFFAVGLVLGEIRESREREVSLMTLERDNLKNNLDSLTKQYHALSQAKETLDMSVITQEQTLSMLYESSQGLRAMAEDEIYPAVLDLMERYSGAEATSVYLLDGPDLVLKESRGDNEKRPQARPAHKGLAGQAIHGKQTTSVNANPPGNGDGEPFVAAAPIMDGMQPVGVLAIEKIPFHKLTPHTLRVLTLLADWCGSSLATAKTFSETKSLLIEDEITSAYTYSFLKERLEEEFSRARRYNLPLSLIVLQVEDFGSYEEEKGWEILRLACSLLRTLLRKIDMIFLGENAGQLILILPCTPAEGAKIVSRKLMEQLEAFHYTSAEDPTAPMAFQIVVQESEESAANGMAFLRQALDALYHTS